MKITLLIVQLLVSIGFISLILLQSSKGGLGKSFGADVVYRSKRGAERAIFTLTIIVAVVFFITSITNALIK